MRLKRLIEELPLKARGSLDREISHLSYDSRLIRSNSLFFALPGSQTDGKKFIAQAVGNGAVAVLSETAHSLPLDYTALWSPAPLEAMAYLSARFYDHPTKNLHLTGVTGTNGKTTVTYFLESILLQAAQKVGVLGTINYRYLRRPLTPAPLTTPLSLDLQRHLRGMVEAGATHVVMEVSSHALALHRVSGCEFAAAIFTNLHSDHLDFHKNIEEYFEAKAKLFGMLQSRSQKNSGVAVLNREDPRSALLEKKFPDLNRISFGWRSDADVYATDLRCRLEGSEFLLHLRDVALPARIGLIGRHNILNALAAAAWAHACHLPPESILEGIRNLRTVPGRLEGAGPKKLPFRVFVDFAHTEGALRQCLESLKALPHRRLLTVFGCGGDRDPSKREPMGQVAAGLSDYVFVTSDNPRREDPEKIVRQIEAGIRKKDLKNYELEVDRRRAIQKALRMAQEGDVLLIAGKGHEACQILGTEKIHFDDREVVEELAASCD
ncbi:MAG: UDP-N-acetylmuramoyl-L-alanyl-D-glutamate--2,6-diaminopimelate ligase [Elusimicrobia bacterium]|nr:UDP-N-acetylmuramoyl-L-alanyl-D-glutamate--2,6-diaminopimelate ligase [Elusimicrobiota bacterium]